MQYKVLAPLDGSPQAECVLPMLRLLATKLELEVRLLRCFESLATVYSLPELSVAGVDFANDQRLREFSMAYLPSKGNELDGIATTAEVECASAAVGILARTDEADLTVMASHGRGGLEGFLLGSVTTKVVRSSRKPVLVVAGPTVENPKLEKIMVGLDGSEFSERALAEASKLALRFGAKLILYRAVPMVYSVMAPEIEMEQAHSDLDRLALTLPKVDFIKLVQRTGGFVDIVERAEELQVDLVVLGSHGRRGLSRTIMGSVAEGVLHEAKCPVMVIH